MRERIAGPLGALGTAVPVLLVMMAVERLGPSLASQVGMIGPLSTILMGVWLLDEQLNAWMVAGTSLVMVGIFVFTRWAKKPGMTK